MFKAKRMKPTTGNSSKAPRSKLQIPLPDEIQEPPNDLCEYMVCVFGTKGIGKSTLGAYWGRRSDEDPNRTVILMSEPGRKNLRVRKPIFFKLRTAEEIMDGADDPWKQLKEITGDLIEDETVENISFDSIDLFYAMAQNSVSANNGVANPSKAGRDASAIWIELRDEFSSYFDALKETNLGVLLLSHIKSRDVETVDGSKFDQVAPSCPPACLQYIKSACDFVFHYSWHNASRCLVIRDQSNDIWTACGVQDRFLQPDGKPVNRLRMPSVPSDVYRTLDDAFHNLEWDADTPDEEKTTPQKEKKKLKLQK